MPRELLHDFLPTCTLTNCLSSPSTFTPDDPQILSLLSATSAMTIPVEPSGMLKVRNDEDEQTEALTNTTSSAKPDARESCNASLSAQSLAEGDFVTSDGAVAHSLGSGGALVHASHSEIKAYSKFGQELLACWQTQSGLVPCDAACAIVEGIGLVAVVANANGATLYAVLDVRETAKGARTDGGNAEGRQWLPLPPQIIPGTVGHSCLAVDVCQSGHIAIATRYGRLAVWRTLTPDPGLSLSEPPFAELEFCEATVFDPGPEVSVEDRITEISFSPWPPPPSRPSLDSCSTRLTLAVGWWSGRLELYRLGKVWGHPLYLSLGRPGEGFGEAPCTCVCFSSECEYLVVTVGHGVLYFIDVDSGDVVVSRDLLRILQSQLRSNCDLSACHIKGLALMRFGGIVLVRGSNGFNHFSYPSQEEVRKSRALQENMRHSARHERLRRTSYRLYENCEVGLTAKGASKLLEHRLSGQAACVRVPFPFDALSIEVVKNDDDWLRAVDEDRQAERRLPVSSITACRTMFAFSMKRYVFAYDIAWQIWRKALSPFDIACSTFASEAAFPGGQERLTLVAFSRDRNVCFWNIAGSGDVASPSAAPLQLPRLVESACGCFNAPGVVVGFTGGGTLVSQDACFTVIEFEQMRVVRSCVVPLPEPALREWFDRDAATTRVCGVWKFDAVMVMAVMLGGDELWAIKLSPSSDSDFVVSTCKRLGYCKPGSISCGNMARKACLPMSLLDVR